FEGGTWGWFKDQVRERATGRSENIVMLSHHAMHHDRFLSWFGYGKYMFSYNEFETISSFTKNYGDHLAINFAGHYHRDMDYDLSRSSGYLVRVVDATHDDDNMIRLVHTTVGSSKISYSEENISVPHYEVPPRPPKPSLPLLPATMEYTLTILDSVGGTTDPNTGSYTYEENTEVTVTTIPDSDYSFDYWELNGEIYTQNPVTITMASDITLHAIFAEIPLPESSSEPELPTEPEPTEIYVASIDMDSIMTRRWWWRYAYAEATVTVYDTDNNPVEGVKVYGHWEGATDDEDSGLSDFKGQATLWSDYKRISRGITFTFVVESLEKDGYVYDPGLNVETSDSVTV
ncbi:MAG: hypothetical protein H3Z50_06675, partial [archaeon]|nr:hypothetical protein [archaeon]